MGCTLCFSLRFFVQMIQKHMKGMILMVDKKKKEKGKVSLTSAQEVTYQRDFKMADQAGGYDDRRSKRK